MIPHKEFMKGVKQGASLEGQTNKDLNCESDEDKKMYHDGIGKSPFAEVSQRIDVKQKGDEQNA